MPLMYEYSKNPQLLQKMIHTIIQQLFHFVTASTGDSISVPKWENN